MRANIAPLFGSFKIIPNTANPISINQNGSIIGILNNGNTKYNIAPLKYPIKNSKNITSKRLTIYLKMFVIASINFFI